jgi:hypothetical protein
MIFIIIACSIFWACYLQQTYNEYDILYAFKKRMEIMIQLLLIISGIGVMFCLYLAIVCLLAASQENMLPDIEDIEIS